MAWLLILLYSFLLVIIIQKTSLFTYQGKVIPYVKYVFLLKVVFSIFYLWIYKVKYGGGDTWDFFYNAQIYTNLLSENPSYYFKILLGPLYLGEPIGFSEYISGCYHCKYTGNMFLIRFDMILVFFSRGYYLVHGVFMALLMTAGYSYMYKLVKDDFKYHNIILTIILCAPFTFIFYTSGIHKDGFSWLFIVMLLYYSKTYFQEKRFKYLFLVLISLFLIGVIRAHILLVTLPLLVSYFISEWRQKQKNKTFLGVLSLQFIIGTIATLVIPQTKVVFEKIVSIKEGFKELGGGSYFETPNLGASMLGMFEYLPFAVINGFFRPFIQDAKGIFQVINSIEVWIFSLLIIVSIIFRKAKLTVTPLYLFILLLGVLICLFDGYLLSNSGVLVRYRAVGYHFILVFFLIGILDIHSLKTFIKKIIGQ